MTGTGNVRRAGAFALVGALSLVAPAVAGRPPGPRVAASVLPFAVVAGYALYVAGEGRAFDLLARPGDYQDGRLYGLAGFSLAAAGLAIAAGRFGMPDGAFVGAVFVLSGGNLVQAVARTRWTDPFLSAAAFAAGGAAAGVGGVFAAAAIQGQTVAPALAVFLGTAGALTGGLLRAVLFERDDPLVMVTVGLLLWLFVVLFEGQAPPASVRVAVGLGVTVALGSLAYALGTASIPGMLTGVLLALLAVVLGGYGWFAILLTFFGLGGLATKFRYDEKRRRGIAEANEGARGSGNVLANSAVALVAVVAFAAADHVGAPREVFRLAFAGSVATAMSDTLSSEIGGLYDRPKLITTLETVEPGTDGAVTWQGEVAGLVGAAVIAAIAAVFYDLSVAGTAVVVLAGVVGMTVDSLLGATVEGETLGNQGVNLVATAAGAAVAALLLLAGLAA